MAIFLTLKDCFIIHKKNFSNSYIFLINQKDSSYIENNFKEYKVLINEENCYLIEKK